jgi:hypothetical protein
MLIRQRHLQGVRHAEPLFVARLGGQARHVRLVVISGVLVVPEQVILTVIELMNLDGKVMHVILIQ